MEEAEEDSELSVEVSKATEPTTASLGGEATWPTAAAAAAAEEEEEEEEEVAASVSVSDVTATSSPEGLRSFSSPAPETSVSVTSEAPDDSESVSPDEIAAI